MKCETLSGFLTFVLGVLVVLGVIFALQVVFVTHETRTLQSRMIQAQGALMEAQSILNDSETYNQKYHAPQLAQILESLQPGKPATVK